MRAHQTTAPDKLMPETSHLLEIIQKRWSPRSFNGKEVETWKLHTLFEAASWAASCFGEEPWRFLLASRSDTAQFDRLLGLLVPKNQEWAQHAGALAISFGEEDFQPQWRAEPVRHPRCRERRSASSASRPSRWTSTSTGWGASMPPGPGRNSPFPDDFEVGAAFAIGYLDGDGAPPAGRKRRPLGGDRFQRRVGQASCPVMGQEASTRASGRRSPAHRGNYRGEPRAKPLRSKTSGPSSRKPASFETGSARTLVLRRVFDWEKSFSTVNNRQKLL